MRISYNRRCFSNATCQLFLESKEWNISKTRVTSVTWDCRRRFTFAIIILIIKYVGENFVIVMGLGLEALVLYHDSKE